MKKYHLWTEGCQMNVADSLRLATALEGLGYTPEDKAEEADVIVLNTCVVRQSAEDRAIGRLTSIRPLKERDPSKVICLMGCLVGQQDTAPLKERFPYVDVFLRPSETKALIEHLAPGAEAAARALERQETANRWVVQDEEIHLPPSLAGRQPTAHVPIIFGCNHVCSFCIIPWKRGQERSRPVHQIRAEVERLVKRGVREVTLLGQIVDRYGRDLNDGTSLAKLLHHLHDIEGLWRIRFLTSHPNYFDDALIEAVRELPKVMEHVEIPAQAGHDATLKRMRRGYTVAEYREVVHRIRERLPQAGVNTDIIVGFSGETEEHFMGTCDLLAELKFDKVHVAPYSPRPHTISKKIYPDDVPPEEKERRRQAVDELQARVSLEKNHAYLGRAVEVLVEEKHKGKWRGRTRSNKLVFFEDPAEWKGRLARVKVTHAGAWSLSGRPLRASVPEGAITVLPARAV